MFQKMHWYINFLKHYIKIKELGIACIAISIYTWGLCCQLFGVNQLVIEWSFIVSGFEEDGESGTAMLTALCLGSDFLSTRCQWPLLTM